MNIKKFATAMAVVSSLTLSAMPALALGPLGAHKPAQNTTVQDAVSNRVNAVEKNCQAHETVVKKIMGRISDRGQKQLDLFTTIATRVETFYTNKGKTLSNYDALVADVNTKKAAAQTVVDTVKSDAQNYTCNSSNAQNLGQTFKTDLKSEISALQAYRTSVKNLIVGVKSVQGTTSSTSNNTSGGNQ